MKVQLVLNDQSGVLKASLGTTGRGGDPYSKMEAADWAKCTYTVQEALLTLIGDKLVP